MVGRDGHEVHVVRHQAPAEDGEAVLIALAAQEVEVEMPIGVGSEYGLAVVAALGDVMRYVDRHDPRTAGHCCDTDSEEEEAGASHEQQGACQSGEGQDCPGGS